MKNSYSISPLENGVTLSVFGRNGGHRALAFRNINAAFRKIKEIEKEPAGPEPEFNLDAAFGRADVNFG